MDRVRIGDTSRFLVRGLQSMFQKFYRSHLIMSTAVKNSPGAGLNTRAASPNKLFSCSHMNT